MKNKLIDELENLKEELGYIVLPYEEVETVWSSLGKLEKLIYEIEE